MKKVGLTVISAVKIAHQSREHKDSAVAGRLQVNKKLQALQSFGGIESEEDNLTPVYPSDAAVSGRSGVDFTGSRNHGDSIRSGNGDSFDPEDPQSVQQTEQKNVPTNHRRAPEQQLTRLALQLGLLEKTASQLGVLAFVWATVVLLGGFVTLIRPYDFWVVTAILITEGARVFSRSHELEWEHAAARSISIPERVKEVSSIVYAKSSKALQKTEEAFHNLLAGTLINLKKHRKANQRPQILVQIVAQTQTHQRKWSRAAIPVLPIAQYFDARRVSSLLYYLQFLSAVVCIGLSVARLVVHKFYNPTAPIQNLRAALLIFYSLSLAEASIFLIERAYWELEINWMKLLVKVHASCRLNKSDLIMVKQFFYDVYSACLKGSVFDGLAMDLVEYNIEKLHSDNDTEQVGSVRILAALVDQEEFAEDALRRLETTPDVLPRLLEMVTWKKKTEMEIRLAAAKIIARLAHRDSNRFRIVAIPGALEGITSTLISGKKCLQGDDAQEKRAAFKEIKLLGLQILKNLAKEETNCVRIGRVHGLFPMVVSFIELENMEVAEPSCSEQQLDINIFRKSLQLLRLLSTATGLSGKALREIIAEAVFLLGNLRDIVTFGGSHPVLQAYAVDILTSLALDEKLKENIGCTGGLIRSLLVLFLSQESQGDVEDTRGLRVRAGEALKLLVLLHSKNCHRLLAVRGIESDTKSHSIVKRLTELFLQQPQVAICAVKIVRNICKYVNEADRAEIVALAPSILNQAFEKSNKMQESILGLAPRIVSLLRDHEYKAIFDTQDCNLDKNSLLKKMLKFIQNLKPSSQLPGIRRHTVELVTALMVQDDFFRDEFKKTDLETQLQKIIETTSEVENFHSFSGALGLNRYRQTMEELVEIARMELRR